MSEYRYKAFISYSHRDERWASWLHRALESYRVPRKLVGSRSRTGTVPARIRPVFRDREELSSASDLSSTVQEALAASENLVVICSPAAAASRWVKEEIREFVRLGRKDRIFCIIVDGDSAADGSVAELFPPAIAEGGLQEPLAADVRKWADGKQLAKLKLVAGILGIRLDELRRRDLQKRRRTQALAALGALAVLAILVLAVTARMIAEQRRDSGQALVEMKLNELRNLVHVSSDPEDLARLREFDASELQSLAVEAGAHPQGLLESALEFRRHGIALWEGGDVHRALAQFEISWALVAESYRWDRTDHEVFFELGQAEFWLGQMRFDLGELDLAEAAFMSYAEITRRLIVQQPRNAQWVLEMAYALSNLGGVQKARGGINPERTLQFMQSALEYNQLALVLDPQNENYMDELGQSHAFLADAQLDVCDLGGALATREEGLRQETERMGEDPDNSHRQRNLAFANTGIGRIQQYLGNHDLAHHHFEEAVLLIEKSSRQDPDAERNQLFLAERREMAVWMDALEGRTDQAWRRSEALADDWRRLLGAVGMEDVWTLVLYAEHLLTRSWLANTLGNHQAAMTLLDEAIGTLASGAIRHPGHRLIENTLVLAVYRYWDMRQELPPAEILSLLPDYGAYNGRTRACLDASRAVMQAVMLKRPAEAEDLVTYLLERGYREADFMRICATHYSC